MPYADRKYRVVSYHDTWISLDPVRYCPYCCAYCVLRYSDSTGRKPEVVVTPEECVGRLLQYSFFHGDKVPIAIGNETDMLHVKNVEYLFALLAHMQRAEIRNPIVLITKAPLARVDLNRLRSMGALRMVFFLSFSGLGRRYEPNFRREQLRENFEIVKSHRFPIVHFWRPLLPENTNASSIRQMLRFASGVADATVFVGLKLHPGLTRILTRDGGVSIPLDLTGQYGEWLEAETIERIYKEAARMCPKYPLYRHTSCAIASVLHRPNHTATVYRGDICPPSQCPVRQRCVCEASRRIPGESEAEETIALLGRRIEFERRDDGIVLRRAVSQEEFAFLLHRLNCPIEAKVVKMQNVYHGNIYEGQKTRP
jgi:DNA repair photolyase